ncbi:MAG: AEC family transporter [Verrucomicrobiota bacterium]
MDLQSYWGLLLVIMPVFAMIGIGTTLRRVGWLTAEADASLLKLVVNFLYPCLIFQSVLGNPALRNPANLLLAPLVGFVTMAAGIVGALWFGKLLGLSIGHGRRTFAFATGIYNYGYIPIALMGALFGRESLGVLLLHNVGCEAAIWTVGILTLSGLSLREGWRKLVNPPVCALILAVGCNLAGVQNVVPGVVLKLIDMSAVCAIPLGLLLIGANLAEYLARPATLFEPRVSIGSCVMRLGLLPPLFLLLAMVLPAPPELKRVMIVQAAMPAGIMPIVIAKHYGGQPLVAVRVVIATTIVGLLVIPLWLSVGQAWVE